MRLLPPRQQQMHTTFCGYVALLLLLLLLLVTCCCCCCCRLLLLKMIVATPSGRLEIITNLVGRHNVYNVLAAVAVGVLLNMSLEDIGAGIESVQFVPGRCVCV